MKDMAATTESVEFAYAVGEEVVVRLAHVSVHDIEAGRAVPTMCVPSWVVALVAGRAIAEDGAVPRYALRLTLHDSPCVAVVEETAIEGVA